MNKEIISLFQKYMDRQCNEQELEQVLQIIEKGAYQQEWNVALSNDSLKIFGSEVEIESINEMQASALNERILYTINNEPRIVRLPNRIKLWPRIAVAASILLVASLGFYFYGPKLFNNDQHSIAYLNDVGPGSNGATLTLANGQKILIKDALAGNIAIQSGVKISKTADGQIIYEITDNGANNSEYNTLSTTRGEQTQVRLPDGTLVFLNAESSLKYPTSFARLNKREVLLTGEGYFEVAKDKAHPFVVKTDRQEVEVFGTHFNISAYSNEPLVKTTLLEGSVSVQANNLIKILKPNQQAQLGLANFVVNDVVGEDVIAWKNGLFVFEDETLENVMKRVERWYDVEVVYQSGVDTQKKYWGGVSRYEKISKLLTDLQLTKNIHFKVEGRRITVMK